MRYKLEKLGCYILIIVLLPYIVTVFLNGPVIATTEQNEEMRVKVQVHNENGSMEGESMDILLRDYGIGILAREIPATYETEALKAQAIMVRTKIYKEMQENGSDTVFEEEFFTKSEMEDAWGVAKYMKYYDKLENAWEETKGQVLMYDEEFIDTQFFSLINGNTRYCNYVLVKYYTYLKIKDCPLDIEAAEHLQTKTLDMNVYGQEDSKQKEKIDIEILSLDTAGYVLKVRVGDEEVSGEEFRKNFNLASSCFSVHEYEGKIRITTRGVGHGIGLSQNTANKMAGEGKSFEEILKYFYDGCEIKEIADVVISDEKGS